MRNMHIVVKPYVEQIGPSVWQARYPERDWHVSGATEEEARRLMREEEARRQQDIGYAEDMCARELASIDPNIIVTETPSDV